MDTGVDTGMDTGTEPGSPPGMNTGTEPGSPPDMNTGTEPGMDTGTEPGSPPGMDTGTEPGSPPGVDTSMETGTEPGIDTGMDTGTEPGMDTGMDTGTEPGMDTGMDTGTEPGIGTGVDTGTEPDMDTGTEPGMDTGVDTGTEPGSPPGMDTGVDTSMDTGTEPGIDTGMDTGTEPGMDTGTEPSVDTGTEPGVDTGMDTGTEPGVDTGVDTGTEPGVDTGVDTGTEPGVDTGMDTGTEPGMDTGTPPCRETGLHKAVRKAAFSWMNVQFNIHSVALYPTPRCAGDGSGWVEGQPLIDRGQLKDGGRINGQTDAQTEELLAERIRQSRDIRGLTVPGSKEKGEVKCSLYMDDVSVFCADGRSIKEQQKTSIEFGKASEAKVNSAKSETLLLGHWTPARDPLPFPIKQDFLKILGVWFSGEGAAEKSWEERLAKTKQKLGLWSLRKLTIEGKSFVLWNETLPVLQYVTQVWPVQPRTAKAITRMIYYFIWNSKMDRVKTEVMFKTHDKGGKEVPDITTILRGIFVSHCVRNTLRSEDKSHDGFLIARFFLLPTWR
ncbi:hypothetical protein NDU88_000607 [Pleurodeles waltl]|uniref:Uncharacterized protein n=1 Tax=Pleurodeles waltl TaxID=8319 RepID=A0AAV7WI28_PLEWA|nr:hypothetical protein NDU88_000607 [Pleurodeles waltl]